jgi:hypothetical protein
MDLDGTDTILNHRRNAQFSGIIKCGDCAKTFTTQRLFKYMLASLFKVPSTLTAGRKPPLQNPFPAIPLQ